LAVHGVTRDGAVDGTGQTAGLADLRTLGIIAR
jgi:hypothetical protein